MKKSRAISISFLSSVAAIVTGCAPNHAVGVHLNASGQCIGDTTGQPVDQRICNNHGGYYGGVHYLYRSSGSGSGSSAASGSTVRGVFGESAAGHAGGAGAAE